MNYPVLAKSQIAMVVIVVGLLSAITAIYRAVNTPLFYFQIAMRSSQPVMAQLFYDVGRGFNEGNSRRLTQPASEVMTLLRFPIPESEYRAIRFHPIADGRCSIAFRDARIVDRAGHIVRSISLQDFQPSHDSAEMQVKDGAITLDLSGANSAPSLMISLVPFLSLRTAKAAIFSFAARDFALLFFPISALAFYWLASIPRRRSTAALSLIFLVMFVLLFARSRFLAPISWDEELFVWQGWMVKNGSVPYRDFFEPKPPLIFFANALGLAIFGLKGHLFRILPTAVAVSSILLFHLSMLRQKMLPWLATLLSAQVALWLMSADFHETGLNDTETYGFAFTLAGFSLGVCSRQVASRFRRIVLQVISGICFGLAISSKELFVASAIPAWILAARPAYHEKWDWHQLLFSAFGVVFVGASILAYLVRESALASYLELVRFYRPMAANYCVDIGRFPRVTGLAFFSHSWIILHDKLYNVAHLAFILPLWAACISLNAAGRPAARLFVALTMVTAVLSGMLAVSVGSCFWKHYFLMGLIGVLLPAVIGAEALNNYLLEHGRRGTMFALVVLSGLFVFVAQRPFREMLEEKPSTQVLDPLAVQVVEAHSEPGDYILSTESPYIYAATNRKSPLGVCGLVDSVLPYTANIPMLRIESLRANLEEHLPKVCYFSSWMRPRQQLLHSVVFDPFLVEHHYIKVTDRLWYLPEER